MTPSKYDPGDEPEVCEQHGRELPCRECRLDAEDRRIEWEEERRKERS
jgi:hypothetical protein